VVEDLLDDFNAYCAADRRSAGHDGRQDLTTGHLYTEAVNLLDAVVSSAKVGGAADLFDVEIFWVVLFKFDWVPLAASIEMLEAELLLQTFNSFFSVLVLSFGISL